MTIDQVRLACEIGKNGIWKLDLDTDEIMFHGDPTILRNLPVGTMESHYATIHPADGPIMREKLLAVNEEHPNYEMEYRASVPGVDGWRWFHVMAKLFPGTRSLFGVGIDCTHQKEREEYLKDQLRSILELKSNIHNLIDNLKITI
jgi:hypothetical protein